jgi:hypothetical protein
MKPKLTFKLAGMEETESSKLNKDANTKERERKTQHILSYLQMEECFKINAILNMNLSII